LKFFGFDYIKRGACLTSKSIFHNLALWF